ncbi:MAG TPA: hypothetical protein VNI57_14270, partial [Candidatus Saccharimonadales bacterium]|nr:hypothetical protein [Candidatus Saccharimonadales bacterium]
MRSSATAFARLGRGFTFGLIAVCALAVGPPLRAQSAQPGPAAKSAAIHRLLQERAAETSPL